MNEYKEIISCLLKKKILVDQEVLTKIKTITNLQKLTNIKNNISSCTSKKDVMDMLQEEPLQKQSFKPNVEVIFSYKDKEYKKREFQDFVKYFRRRYQSISAMLKNRQELQKVTSISKILDKQDSEQVALIGMVQDIGETKSGHIMLTMEDLTGSMKVMINKNHDLFKEGKNIVLDEVIGIIGSNTTKKNQTDTIIVFSNEIFWPEIPLQKEYKKAPKEAYAAFISDIHVGSSHFLKDRFEKFISWLNSDDPMVEKLHYLFIGGDVVFGVGIYPGQEQESEIKDIFLQYKEFVRYMKQIPSRIQIVICPGNHDGMRLAEPQPIISELHSPELHQMENVTLVTNPSTVRFHKTNTFPGFDLLFYHGFSFTYYVSNVESIRNEGGYHRADLIMEFLLRRRHVCPTHTSAQYIPDAEFDPLVIDIIPDFFLTGHIHYTSISKYNNITLISGSCWEGMSQYQEKQGHTPEPCFVAVSNLQTREVKVLEF